MDFPPYHFRFSFVHTWYDLSQFRFHVIFALIARRGLLFFFFFWLLSQSSRLRCPALNHTNSIYYACKRASCTHFGACEAASPHAKVIFILFYNTVMARHRPSSNSGEVLTDSHVNVTCCHNCHGAALIAIYIATGRIVRSSNHQSHAHSAQTSQ